MQSETSLIRLGWCGRRGSGVEAVGQDLEFWGLFSALQALKSAGKFLSILQTANA